MRSSLAGFALCVACSSESVAIEPSPDAGTDSEAPQPPGLSCGWDGYLPSSGPTRAPAGEGLEPATGLVLGSTFVDDRITVDLDGDGVRDLAYLDGASVVALLSRRSFAWSPASVHLLSDRPSAFAVADVDGDGRPELLTAIRTGSIVVDRVGDFGVEPLREIPGKDFVDGLVAKDVDRDGRIDLVVATPAWKAVGFLRGHGDGTFDAPSLFASGNSTTALRVVDLDLDGFLDVIVVPTTGQSVGVLRGRGDGTFGPRQAIQWGACAASTQSLDLDGDGELDAIATTSDGEIRAMRFRDGSVVPVELPQGSWSLSADFDGDHQLDLLGRDAYGPQLSRGLGPVSFAPPKPFVDPGFDVIAGVFDIDGDGRPDLLGSHGSTASVAIATGPLEFKPPTSLVPAIRPALLSTGRAIAGVTTLVATDTQHSSKLIVSHTKTRTWTRDPDVTLASNAIDEVVVRDLDDDGVDDLLTTSTVSGLQRAFGRKGGGFGEWQALSTDDWLRLSVVDVDGDGTLDLVSLGGARCAEVRFDIAGAAEKTLTIGGPTRRARLRDVDRDGRIDLLCEEDGPRLVRWMRDTEGGFVDAGKFSSALDFVGLTDLDGDGHDELVLLGDGALHVRRGTGLFAFGVETVSPFAHGAETKLVDFDGDGLDDVVALTSDSARELLVASGRSDLRFAPAVAYSTFADADFSQLSVTDVDGDGRLDVAMIGVVPPSLRVRYGKKP